MNLTSPPPPVVAPNPGQNQVDAVGVRSAQERARGIAEAHRKALQARRERDLISEKLLLHIDGSGDLQWADIFEGQRVEIPRFLSEFRDTENLLRPIVDNAVAQHVTMPLHYFADSTPDRESKEKALVDTVWMNHVAEEQDFNGKFAEALYLAIPAGFAPVHRYWSESPSGLYEPVEYGVAPGAQGFEPTRGNLHVWVGNPFDTSFNAGAKRGKIGVCRYGRVLPASAVREAFQHIPAARSLEGSTRMPSAAIYQRLARQWVSETGLSLHGSPALTGTDKGDEELIALICEEIAPGYDPRYPQGWLSIIAIPGSADIRRDRGNASHAVLLADQPLPAGDFSWSLFYSHAGRSGDPHGKPWAEDIDQLQVKLNMVISKEWEVINRQAGAPIVAPAGAIGEDMADFGGYNLLEIEPSMGGWQPRVMEWPSQVLTSLEKKAERIRNQMFTIGGYQAASRGEGSSGQAFRAIVALQQADDTIHGPVQMMFKRSAVDFARGCWRQMKTYGDVPWLVNVTGDEYAHLAEPWVDKTRLSDEPPRYRLTNAFGASIELRAQEVLNLVTTQGADGQPFLRTDEARRQYPNQFIFDDEGDPKAVQKRRAKTVSTGIRQMVRAFRQQTGFDEQAIAQRVAQDLPPEWQEQAVEQAIQQAAMQVVQKVETRFKRSRSDDLQAHIAALIEIEQDETEDPIARAVASWRLDRYYEWQQMMAMQGAPSPMGGDGAAPASGGPQGGGPLPQARTPEDMPAAPNDRGTTLDPAVIAAGVHGGAAA